MKTVAPEILEGLAEFDSATVQNAAAIVYGGYISEHIDYSGPGLEAVSLEPGWVRKSGCRIRDDIHLDAY